MHVRIYQPAKTTMQSGRAKTQVWLLEPETIGARAPEPLMGWTAANNTLIELLGKLKFSTAEQAAAFAASRGWSYTIITPQARVIEPRNYLHNFK